MELVKTEEVSKRDDLAGILGRDLLDRVFPSHLKPVPQLNEVYELELAFYESQILSDEEIIRNGAYFARVDGVPTRHYLICKGEPVKLAQHSSSRLKSFFQNNIFKTGYATHGLFPYRGKFHPQMIKALMNVMGLKPGDTVLDPMMGSGTVLIEAKLMGINSVGVDASPFCRFMTQAKLDGLQVPLEPIKAAVKQSQPVFDYFSNLAGKLIEPKRKIAFQQTGDLFSKISGQKASKTENLPKGFDLPEVYNFLLLAFLDGVGYSQRSAKKGPFEQFQAIVERYAFVSEKIQKVLEGVEEELAEAASLEGDARHLQLKDNSIDGVIFSPPYSFAINYLANDGFHLQFLGVDVPRLKESMVGLRGRNINDQFELYKQDMEKILVECARVLRPGKICTIVVGTNNNQLSQILKVPPEKVKRIDQILAELGEKIGLRLIRRIGRQITGMANTMRTEYIIMLQRI